MQCVQADAFFYKLGQAFLSTMLFVCCGKFYAAKVFSYLKMSFRHPPQYKDTRPAKTWRAGRSKFAIFLLILLFSLTLDKRLINLLNLCPVLIPVKRHAAAYAVHNLALSNLFHFFI